MRHVAYKTWAQGRLARQRGDVETNNTTARPQQGTAETGITSAPEKHAKTTHFSPAKAMTVSVEARPAPAKAMAVSIPHRYQRAKATGVSIPHRYQRAKATPVSGNRAPLVWRAPEGPHGLAAAPTGSNNTTATQISHVIYRGHFSRHPKNVAIPTMQIQCLNKSQGNYVRN